MNEEISQEEIVQEKVDTKHEPHHHARSRLYIGLGAVAILFLLTLFIWPKWGEDIKEACFGDGEVCTIDISGGSSSEEVDFETTLKDFDNE